MFPCCPGSAVRAWRALPWTAAAALAAWGCEGPSGGGVGLDAGANDTRAEISGTDAGSDAAVGPGDGLLGDAPDALQPGDTVQPGDAVPPADTTQPADSLDLSPDAAACTGVGPGCVTGCGSDAMLAPKCVSGMWICPPGSVDVATCPPGLCVGPPPPDTECVDGNYVCKPGYFSATPGAACEPDTCDNIADELAAQLGALVNASNGCQIDADCTHVPTGTECQGTCGTAIHHDAQAAFAAQLAAIDAHLCKATAYKTKCGYSTPKCIAPAPGCVAGKCVYKK